MKAFLNSDKVKTKRPEWFERLMDTLFEGMPNADGKEFRLLFAKSIPIGFDNWQHIYHQLCLHILEKECKNTDHPLVKQAICDIITLHRTEETDQIKWSAAWSAAESAAWSVQSIAGSIAGSIARSAAWSAESAAQSATWPVWSAASKTAESVAWSASYAAWSARSIAESAAKSATWFPRSATFSVGSVDWSVTYKSIADKLLELLKEKKK